MRAEKLIAAAACRALLGPSMADADALLTG